MNRDSFTGAAWTQIQWMYSRLCETSVVFGKRHSQETTGHQTSRPSPHYKTVAIWDTGSVLVIVFSFSRRPPVTTVFSHAAWAEPHCDTDLPKSVGVTVPGSPVPLQKQTWFSFPTPLMAPLFSSRRSTGSGLYKFLFGESLLFLSLFFFFLLPCDGNVETVRVFCISDGVSGAVMDVMFPLEVFCLWQSLSISERIATAQWCCYVMDLLFYTELIYTPFCNGISSLFCLVFFGALACFSALTSGSNAEWDVRPPK